MSSSSDDDDELMACWTNQFALLSQFLLEDESSSSGEDQATWGGSRRGKKANKFRDFDGAFARVVEMYFSGNESLYNEGDFERRFGVPRVVFNEVQEFVIGKDPFVRKFNPVTGRLGIHPLVRLVSCYRMLIYGDAADRNDEFLQLSESVASASLKDFCRLVVEGFKDGYLNKCPTDDDKRRALDKMERRGFPGCFASWDCKHYDWKNCPMRLAGQHKGKAKSKTLVMEAICDPDLYVWYFFFGEPGSLNDINILDRSSIVGAAILRQSFNTKTTPYVINGTSRDWIYFLVDGIYPQWGIFAKTNPSPVTEEEQYYKARHEHVRKDIERCFGVLVAKFGILKQPIRNWYLEDVRAIVECCIILHNMTTKIRRDDFTYNDLRQPNGEAATEREPEVESLFAQPGVVQDHNEETGVMATLAERIQHMTEAIEMRAKHLQLQSDLAQHIWDVYRNNSS